MNCFTYENCSIVKSILDIVCKIEGKEMTDDINQLIDTCSQPCRLEKLKSQDDKTIILDVCHNIDGFRAVFKGIKCKYPQVKEVKIVMGISKSKKLE